MDCLTCRDTGRVTEYRPTAGNTDAPIGKRCPVCSGPREGNAWVAQARRDREAADAAVDAACAVGDFGPVTDHTQHGAAGRKGSDDQ